MNLPPYQLVTTLPEWQFCLRQLQSQSQLAIDLEANSMYAYREQVCLIQISIPSQDYIIDPLAKFDFNELGELLETPTIEKIFHAAEYDLMLLKRQFGWKLTNLFDTMWAARILGYQRYGLASILEKVFQVKLNKRHQKSNWCQRPLTTAQLTYAQHDTHHLIQLRQHLYDELKKMGHLEEAQDTFVHLTHVKLSDNRFNPNSFWSIHGVNELSRQGQAVLKALHIYRDKEAHKRNRPLFKIFSDKTLIELARKMPHNSRALRLIHGMTPGQVRRYGRQLLHVIQTAKNAPHPPFPKRPKRPSDEIISRYEKLHNWRKLRAQKRGVESDVILSRDLLWALAEINPQTIKDLAQIDGMGQWRSQTYGTEILNILHNK